MYERAPYLGKSLSALILAWLVACSAADDAILDPEGDPLEAGTPLPGIFDDDTTLTGELVVRRMLQVARGTTLSVAPGTTMLFRDTEDSVAGIDVAGVLLAPGSSELPIRFGTLDTVPRPGDWEGITVHGGSALLTHTRIDHARIGLRVTGGARARIDTCVIDSHAISAVMSELGWIEIAQSALSADQTGAWAEGGGFRVTGGSIAGEDDAGFRGHASSDTLVGVRLEGDDALVLVGGFESVVRSCTLDGRQHGARLVGRIADAVVDSNLVLPSIVGILVIDARRTRLVGNSVRNAAEAGIECRDADVELLGNSADSCDIGLWLAGGDVSALGNSLVSNHTDGARIDAGMPLISGNVFADNGSHGGYGLRTEVHGIDASGNWWGDPSGPEQEIYNPDGLGDRVTRPLIVSPWLIAPPD